MPNKSRAQQRLMQGIAHGNIKPRKGLPPKSVAQEFVAADHARGSTKLPERIGHAIVQGRSAKDL
jgi:hypothetical protein